MKLFVTGGAGNTGTFFMRQFLEADPRNRAVCIVRSSIESTLNLLDPDRVTIVVGDVTDEPFLAEQIRGCDAVINIAQQRLSLNVLRASQKAGVQRVFFVTTTGVFSKFNALTQEYRQIEEEIRQSSLEWTILRPTMIYGTKRDYNMHKLLSIVNRSAVYPVFGDGRGLMQPVHAEDLATGLRLAVQSSQTSMYKEYNFSGKYPLTYNEIVREAAAALGKRIRLIHLPYRLSLYSSMAGESLFGARFPVKSEQVLRLSEDKSFSWAAAAKELGYLPRDFAQGIRDEAALLKQEGLL